MSKKDKHNRIKDLLLYLRGKLSGKEKNRIERNMQKDPFEAEAMEGFNSFEADEIEEDLLEIHSRINRRVKRKNRFIAYRIAASIAIIIALSLTFFLISDREMREVPVKPEISESLELPEEKTINKVEEKQEVSEPKAKKEPDKEDFPEEKPVREGTEPPVAEKDEVVKRPELDMTEIGEEIVQVEEAEKVEGEIRTEEVVEITAPPEAEETVEEAVETQKKAEAQTIRQRSLTMKKSLSPDYQIQDKLQNRISGVVISAEDSLPIPGATVRIEGTRTGTVTDAEGRFELSPVHTDQPELVVSFIGMDPVKTTAHHDRDIQITMQPNSLALDEVVVIGYGATEKSDLSGSVSTVEDIDRAPENTYKGAYPSVGKSEFRKYIEENIVFPESELERAVVVLKFVISRSGRPVNLEVVRSPGEEFSSEAKRLLKEGPDWIPAENEGKYIEDKRRVRIVFKKNN